MRLGRRLILGLALLLALVLLTLNIVVALTNVRDGGGAVRQAGRSRAVLSQVAQILLKVQETEGHQRNYLYTGQDVYLEPYRRADGMLPGLLDHLETLTGNDPAQRQRTTSLRAYVRRKREELASSLALRRDKRSSEAVREVRSGVGRRLMDQVRRLADEMEGHEQRTLAARLQVSRAAFRTTVRAIVISTVLALGLLALAVHLRRRELAERERRAEAARQSEARLATTILSIGDAVISTDERGDVQLMNPIAEALTGYGLSDAVGRPLAEVLPLVNEVTRKPAENPAERVIRDGVIMGLANHTLLVARDGSEIPIDDSAAPIKDSAGRVIGVIIVFRDITDRRRVEADRERLRVAERAALAEAEEANRAKDRFLAILSHELRTPLNPIMLAVTSMLARPVAPEDLGPTLEMIRENVALEARLIDDLLDVMRIASGKMSLHLAPVECHRLIRHALQICQIDAHGKELSVVLDLAAREDWVYGDATRLEQVFWNLIKNAFKFTPAGGTIQVRSWNESAPAAGGDWLVLEFTDTGIGIEPEALPWVFDPFHQGEGSITRKYGGMGLGLAISRGVVEAHGGQLAVESPGKNQGATLRLRLKVEHPPARLETAATPPPALERTVPQASLRILVVEDEPTTLIVMARLLRRLGHEVTTASTVQETLEVAEGAEFDVAVSDIGLPDGSGLDLVRQLLADRDMPVIALTGFGMQEDIRRSREAGFAAHLTKPIDFAKLVTTIRQVTSRPKARKPLD